MVVGSRRTAQSSEELVACLAVWLLHFFSRIFENTMSYISWHDRPADINVSRDRPNSFIAFLIHAQFVIEIVILSFLVRLAAAYS